MAIQSSLAIPVNGTVETKNNTTYKDWPLRESLHVGVKNVQRKSLVDPEKVLLPSLHIKLGLMKQFVKALVKEGECFRYLCGQFPGLSHRKTKAKLKRGIFVGPDIRKLMRDPNFLDKMETNQKAAWKSFKLVVTGFLSNKRDPNYKTRHIHNRQL